MKKISYIFVAAVSALIFPSCAKEADPDVVSVKDEPVVYDDGIPRVTLEFSAGCPTKTVLDGKDVTFESSDVLGVFDGVAKNEFLPVRIDSDGRTAVFRGEAVEVENYNLVLPASAISKTSDAASAQHISIYMDNKQYVDADHPVDPKCLISTAYAAPFGKVQLKNQVSFVKIEITRSDVLSVKLIGNNDESFGGTQFLSTTSNDVIQNCGGKGETLYFRNSNGENDVFEPGTYYIAIWPVVFENGFTLKIKTTDKGIAIATTDKRAEFTANGGMNLGAVDSDTRADFVSPIMTAGQLKLWAAYNRFWDENDEIVVGADIDLEGYNWPTVDSYFATLNGNYHGVTHKITNFTIDNAKTRTGFIGTLETGAVLKNIRFGDSSDNSSITLCQSDNDKWCYAGIVGYVNEGAVINNVQTYVPVTVSAACTGKHSVGGIAGNMKADTRVSECVNWAAVTDNSSYASASADSCIGGIVGMSDSAGSIILDCTNEGEQNGQITNNCTGTPHIGGIVGRLSGSGTVENCTNNAYVVNEAGSAYSNDSFKVFVGGIVGAVTGSDAQIIKCVNEQRELANASLSTRLGLGGIVGGATGSGLQILGCKNNTGAMNIGFSNSKDVAIGGIIGQSNNTIRISKAADGTWTENCKGYTQNKNFGGTAYIGGIAGMLDKASTDNIVEYCKTSASARFEFNDKQTTNNKAANVGGICGASKGVITNCTNNMHIYCRKSSNGYPKINFGGICGGYSDSRYPQEISYCTNNGNVGAYAATKGDPTFGGIICALYPGKTVVKFCTNRGALTTGQAKTDGTICSIQNHGGFSMGALSGEVVNTPEGSSPITIFEGCVVDSRAIASKVSNYDFMGLVCGWLAGTKDETGHPVVNFGSVENPVMITTTSAVKTGTNADPTVETAIATATDYDSIKAYLFAPYLFYRPDKAINFPDGIDSDAFKARYKLNIVFGPAGNSTERFN